jgi:hypothetical protein
MDSDRTLHSELTYWKELASAGWTGFASTCRETKAPVFSPPLGRAAWAPIAAGATLGLLGARYANHPRKKSNLALGSAVGTAVGFAAAAVWGSRHLTKAAARNAARRINGVRDAHWLELNPIDYA